MMVSSTRKGIWPAVWDGFVHLSSKNDGFAFDMLPNKVGMLRQSQDVVYSEVPASGKLGSVLVDIAAERFFGILMYYI